AVLARVKGADLVMVRADGSTFVAHTFGTAPGSSDPPTVYLDARDGFVSAISSSYWDGAVVSEALLLRASGEILWQTAKTDDSFAVPELGPGGGVAYGVASTPAIMIVGPDGAVTTVPDAMPVGAPTADGRVPLYKVLNVYAPLDYGWYDPDTAAIDPLAFP